MAAASRPNTTKPLSRFVALYNMTMVFISPFLGRFLFSEEERLQQQQEQQQQQKETQQGKHAAETMTATATTPLTREANW